MRIPVALYPFSAQLLPAVKAFEQLQDKYTLQRLVSHPGFGLTGQDAGYSRNHPHVGIIVTDELDLADPGWDLLLLIQTLGAEAENSSKLETAAERALQLGKSVRYLADGSTEVPDGISALAEVYSGMVIHNGSMASHRSPEASNDAYKDVSVPIVLVGGLVEEADTLEVVLRLTALLRADGFQVTTITNNPVGQLFGLHTLSHITNRKDLAEARKISELNQFVRKLEAIERPQVVLIEAPDAVLRYNDFAPNGFGIYTYMLCQAVRPDHFVCCVPCEMAVGPFLEAISSDFAHRLGMPVHATHVSNLIVHAMDIVQTRSISYTHSELAAVREQIDVYGQGSPIPLFDVVSNGVEGLYTHLNSIMRLERPEKGGDLLCFSAK